MNTTSNTTQTTNKDITAALIAFRNKKTASDRDFENQVHMAIGTLTIIHEEDSVTYGFKDLLLWIPSKNENINLTADDEDHFMVNAPDFDSAKAEFWGRWRIFTRAAFKINFVRIEMRGQPNIIRDSVTA